MENIGFFAGICAEAVVAIGLLILIIVIAKKSKKSKKSTEIPDAEIERAETIYLDVAQTREESVEDEGLQLVEAAPVALISEPTVEETDSEVSVEEPYDDQSAIAVISKDRHSVAKNSTEKEEKISQDANEKDAIADLEAEIEAQIAAMEMESEDENVAAFAAVDDTERNKKVFANEVGGSVNDAEFPETPEIKTVSDYRDGKFESFSDISGDEASESTAAFSSVGKGKPKVYVDTVVIAKKQFDNIIEAYDAMSREQKSFYDSLKKYALTKAGSTESLSRNYECVKIGKKIILKLRIKRGITFAAFMLENSLLKSYRKSSSKVEGADIKIKETEVPVSDLAGFETAKDMIDLMIENIEREKAEKRKKKS